MADQVVVVMKLLKGNGAKGLACLVSQLLTTSNGMIDYYETKSQPITRVMVWQAYKKVKANKGGSGIDDMDWEEFDINRSSYLYKLWNRMSSGSYFPMPVKEVPIQKKSGGERKLGIPTILDRIAQQVAKTYLERILELVFHESSYGYRPARSCHQAVEKALDNTFTHQWMIDLDIKSFFDEIDHELLIKALTHYCKDKWILLYVKRWLKAGIVQQNGDYLDRISGTPQGAGVSPLLANLFLHVVFDGWMKQRYPHIAFERYADDILVHCKSEKQAISLLEAIKARLKSCRLTLHKEKTKIAHLRGASLKEYAKSVNFLGFTIRPDWVKVKKGCMVLPSLFISRQSISCILEKFRNMRIHKWRRNVEEVAKELNPVINGVINYYKKVVKSRCSYLWYQLNLRLLKWVKWEKGLSTKSALCWLKKKFKEKPGLFAHWKLVYP